MDIDKKQSMQLVKALRERTGAGVVDCSKALKEHQYDLEKAIEYIELKKNIKAKKHTDRTTAEGKVIARVHEDGHSFVMFCLKCETDFVARSENFMQLADQIASVALAQSCADRDAFMSASSEGKTVEAMITDAVATFGENMVVTAYAYGHDAASSFYNYSHNGLFAAVVGLSKSQATLGRDIAMHVTAASPLAIAVDGLDAKYVDNQKAEIAADIEKQQKTVDPSIREKIVAGKLNKYFAQVVLMEQDFVKNPDVKIKKMCQDDDLTVTHMVRMSKDD